MLSGIVVVCVTPPDVPVNVRLYCPAGVVLLAVSVNTLLFVVGFVENKPVTPLGRPDTARLTLPVNPYCSRTFT
jgi:hypothetical protein